MSSEPADVVRESVAWMVAELMEVEVSSQIGAGLGEVAPAERTSQRNGYRARGWDTRAGAVELAIAKLRQGSYFPSSAVVILRFSAIVVLLLRRSVTGPTILRPAVADPPQDQLAPPATPLLQT